MSAKFVICESLNVSYVMKNLADGGSIWFTGALGNHD